MSRSQSASFDVRDGLERMRQRTREARETEASRLFGGESVAAVLSAAAAKGLTTAIFTPSSPMDLSGTEAGKALAATLKSAGFATEWKRVQTPADTEPHTFLRVSWGDDAKPARQT